MKINYTAAMETLADRVVERRKALGLTQKELASRVTKAGFPLGQSAISSIEKRGDSHPQCMYELAVALEVNLEWLRSGKGPMLTYIKPSDAVIRGSRFDNFPEVPGLTDDYAKQFGLGDHAFHERPPGAPKEPRAGSVDFPRLPKDVPIFPSWPTTATHPDRGIGSFFRPTQDEGVWPTSVITDVPRGFALRLPAIAKRDDVFCMLLTDGLMHPWRSQTEPIFVERLRPPHIGSHVVIVLQELPDPLADGLGTTYQVSIGQVIGGDSERLVFRRYNPPTTFTLEREWIKNIWRVIEWRELMSDLPLGQG
jgi:transcriptional regulator with XRE-family HTH domain